MAVSTRAQPGWRHPFTILGLDPADGELTERAINRGRKRALADLETSTDGAVGNASDITQASDLLAEPEQMQLFAALWDDEPLRAFLETADLSWAARIRSQPYHASESFGTLIIPSIRASFRQAVIELRADPDVAGAGMTALNKCIDGQHLPPACDVAGVVATVCGEATARLNAIRKRVDDGSHDPDLALAEEVAAEVNLGFYNHLPPSLADCRVTLYRSAQGIALAMYNGFDAAIPSLHILTALEPLDLPERHAVQLRKNLVTLRDAAHSEEIQQQFGSVMAACRSDVVEKIDALDLDAADAKSEVARLIVVASVVCNGLPAEVSGNLMDEVAISLRSRSIDLWNAGSSQGLAVWLLEKALACAATEDCRKRMRTDLAACGTSMQDISVKVIGTSIDFFMEAHVTIAKHGAKNIKYDVVKEHVSKRLNMIREIGIVADMGSLIPHDHKLAKLAQQWCVTLRTAAMGAPSIPAIKPIRSIILEHLAVYGPEWPGMSDLAQELRAEQAKASQGGCGPAAGALAIIAVIAIIALIGAFSSSDASTPQVSRPPPAAPAAPPPKPVVKDYASVIQSAAVTPFNKLFYDSKNLPAEYVVLTTIPDHALDQQLGLRYDAVTDDMDRWRTLVMMINRHRVHPTQTDAPCIATYCVKAATSAHLWLQLEGVSGLGYVGTRSHVPLLQNKITNPNEDVRVYSYQALIEIVARELPALPPLMTRRLKPATASESYIYDALRVASIIDQMRPKLGNAAIPRFNRLVDNFNAYYGEYSYYPADMNRAKTRVANDKELISVQGQVLLYQLENNKAIP